MARYVDNAAVEPSARPPALVPAPESGSRQASAESGHPDQQVLDTRSIEGSEVVIIGTVVHAYPYNVMDLIPATLCHLAKRAALVLCAIDDAVALLAVNRLLFGILEVLYVALHSRGSSGHLVVTVPHVSACLQCALDVESPAQIQTLHAEPALGLDIQTVASYAATAALEVICARVTGRPVERWDIAKNVFYFANKREQLSPDGPGVVLQRAQKRPGCPVCWTAPGTLLVRS